jgi:hypothetical protein
VRHSTALAAALALLSPLALAQTSKPDAKPAPDVIVFQNGDRLTGKLERAQGGNVIFASDMAGELTISFDKIKELNAGEQFALVRKGAPLKPHTVEPEGTVAVAEGKVRVSPPGAPEVVEAPANVGYLVPKAEFDKQMTQKARFIDGWNGTLTGGATLVRSTTSATTLTAGLSLVRAIPTVDWIAPRNRTTIDVNESYGKNTSPGAIPQTVPPTPSVTTLSSIFHADAERDQYLSPRVYALGDTAFDHNYAQGLQLQQLYGGGIGWTAIKNAKQELDLKADVHYETQKYITAPVNGAIVATTPTTNIFGSTFFEAYHRNLPRKVVFTEIANILPAFTNSRDYSGNLTASLSLPVFKRLSATLTGIDNYLNDPAVGYRKNSIQFITGVTYALK